jgi:hypothetical protein
MERCPNCGTPARPGAKFCTTCGARFPEGDDAAPATAGDEAPESGEAASEPESERAAQTSGWPETAGRDETTATTSTWESLPAADTPEQGQSDEIVEVVASTWGAATTTWPSAPHGNAEAEAAPEPESPFAPPRAQEALIGEITESDGSESTVEHARSEANELLDRLREAIARLGGENDRELEDVIAELDVAVTPPGAMAPDAVAELREALLSARERPRDIDTMVDLSRRLDAVVALAFAYDRAIAAIERALAILRER